MARAIKKLRVLGGGFTVVPVGGRRLVQSIPGELNMDHTSVLQKAEVSFKLYILFYLIQNQSTAYVNKSALIKDLGWTDIRVQNVLVSTVVVAV